MCISVLSKLIFALASISYGYLQEKSYDDLNPNPEFGKLNIDHLMSKTPPNSKTDSKQLNRAAEMISIFSFGDTMRKYKDLIEQKLHEGSHMSGRLVEPIYSEKKMIKFRELCQLRLCIEFTGKLKEDCLERNC